jgi:hypothetical protein
MVRIKVAYDGRLSSTPTSVYSLSSLIVIFIVLYANTSQAFYILALAIGAFIGALIHFKKYKPLEFDENNLYVGNANQIRIIPLSKVLKIARQNFDLSGRSKGYILCFTNENSLSEKTFFLAEPDDLNVLFGILHEKHLEVPLEI